MRPLRTHWWPAVLAAAILPVPAAADTLVSDVDGLTIDEDGAVLRFTGLVFDDDGRITRLLQRGDPRPQTEFAIDGEGRVMLPGMIDAHVNLREMGIGALTLDLAGTTSLEDALETIRRFAAENPGRPWIIGRGWNEVQWGLARAPTAAELDSAVADRPVWLTRADGGAHWANSAAMQAAGITKATKSPPGGMIVRSANGEPTGIFLENAADLVRPHVPRPRPEERDAAFAKAQDMLIARGITAVADMGSTLEDWQTYRRAGDTGRLKVRIMSYAASVEALELIAGPGPTPWLYADRLRMGGLALRIDGTLGARGGLLLAPYADQPGTTGLALLTPAQLRNLMSRAALDNFQTAVLASGDGATRDVLNAVEELSESYTGDRRWRIEHAAIVDPADLRRFGTHGIIASMQPPVQVSDYREAEARLGPDRLDGAHAWRSVLAAGGRLAFGSGAPTRPADPFAGLAAAVSRTDSAGEPFGGWRAQEAVSRETALRAFTADAAFAGFADGRFGRLLPGERADFVFVDRDPMLASPQALRELRVLEVWIGGQRVDNAQGAQ